MAVRRRYLLVSLAAGCVSCCAQPAGAGESLDYDQLASAITRALALRQGEHVLIRFDPSYFDSLVEPLRERIRASGAVNLPSLSAAAPLTGELLSRADVLIRLPLRAGARPLDAADDRARIAWLDHGGSRRELHFHWSEGTRRPDGLPADHPPEFDALYLAALDIDYSALDAAQQRALDVMQLGTVRVQTPAGTDLMFRVGRRPFNRQNGDASPARVRQARVRVDREIELPAGVLRVAPVEDSVCGNISLPEARFGDTVAKGVVFEIDNGRISRVRAKEGLPAVEAFLAAGGDAARRFREFGLGFNPRLTQPPGTSLIPYFGYGAGVVRLSLGDSQELGGNVRGDFVRWFFFADATVHVDFRYLVRAGKLVVNQ